MTKALPKRQFPWKRKNIFYPLADLSLEEYTDTRVMNQRDKTGGEAAIITNNSSFKDVVDETCDRLWDKKIRYSIRRIQELADTLEKMEEELDLIIQARTN
jgi:hypothetical protein